MSSRIGYTRQANTRRIPRHAFTAPVSIAWNDFSLSGWCVDISSEGILVSVDDAQKLGDALDRYHPRVSLKIGTLPGHPLTATVIRSNSATLAMRFDTLIGKHGKDRRRPGSPGRGVVSRLLQKITKSVWIHSRRWSVYALNKFALRTVLKATNPDFLFAVYGNRRDVSRYISEAQHARLPDISIGNFLQLGQHRGFVVAPRYYEHELAESPEKVAHYLDGLKTLWPGVHRIALVGRLPTFARNAGLNIDPPFVEGSLGTRYMLLTLARELKTRPEYQDERSIIVLGGAGRIGRALCDDLAAYFDTVIAFDKRYDIDFQATGKILETSNPTHFVGHRLYIVLTARGSAVEALLPFISSGSILADDTHPSIETPLRQACQARGIDVEKAVLTNQRFTAFPKMPQWRKGSIPGCLVEALVMLDEPDARKLSLDEFSVTAKRLGYEAKLFKPFTPQHKVSSS